jgi:hypothetical protein
MPRNRADAGWGKPRPHKVAVPNFEKLLFAVGEDFVAVDHCYVTPAL